MNILYIRVSTLEQSTERQRINDKNYDLVIEDRCSGATPFFERPGGQRIQSLVSKGLKSISVVQIDRLGRNLRDIINVIHHFSERNICIHFLTQGLRTIEPNGKENAITKMIISILGIVAEMERNQIKERTTEGIRLAKARGVYKGRKTDTKEDAVTFLSKEKNKKAVEYLKKGYKSSEAATLAGIHPNTVSKIKKYIKLSTTG